MVLTVEIKKQRAVGYVEAEAEAEAEAKREWGKQGVWVCAGSGAHKSSST